MRTQSKKSACGAFCLISLACGAFYFIKNLACGAFFSWNILFLIIRGCISSQVFYSVYQFISSENDLNSNTEWSQRHNLYQTVITKVSNNKPFVKSNLLRFKLHNTISIPKQLSLSQRYLCVGCPIKSDQAIRSLCLKGHVRARGSTLWRHRWQEASEFFCTKANIFGESWATKNIAKKTRKCSLWRATSVMFSKFRGWRRKKKTALRAIF